MGILSKLTSTASSSITIGTVLAKTASLAAVQVKLINFMANNRFVF